jgi:hypothetical protein
MYESKGSSIGTVIQAGSATGSSSGALDADPSMEGERAEIWHWIQRLRRRPGWHERPSSAALRRLVREAAGFSPLDASGSEVGQEELDYGLMQRREDRRRGP